MLLNIHQVTKIEVKQRLYKDDGFAVTDISIYTEGRPETPMEIAAFSNEQLIPKIFPPTEFPQDPTAGVLP